MKIKNATGHSLAAITLMFIGTQAVVAGSMGEVAPPMSFVATLSAGPVWPTSLGRNQTINLVPSIEKTYINQSNQSNQTLVDGELFLGVQTSSWLPYSLQGQLGIAVATTSQAGLSGEIWDDGDPLFNNYSYNYQVRHTHVALKGKLLADRGYYVTPWLSGSIGVGFNDSNSFNSVPLIYEAVPTPPFRNHTVTSFIYTVGAGVQRNITENCQVGVGYEFSDWGNSNLGRAPAQTEGRGLTLNHLYTNGLMFSISYVS
ncbi:outer membrane protein [Legionella sp.]|uniref:outer membrane protein n=1 Tax=Legionella sp. TaxID=459 RepID=UPI003C9781D1